MTRPTGKFNEKPAAAAPRRGRSRAFWRGAAVLALAVSVTACQPRIDARGYVPAPEDIERIKTGVQGRDEVREILGSPSSVSNFADDRWYYISKKTRTVAFYTPEVLEQSVVVVEFDDTGFVKDLHQLALEDGQIIDPVTRKTPSPGRELSFLEQLLGNLGRFNAAPKGPAGL